MVLVLSNSDADSIPATPLTSPAQSGINQKALRNQGFLFEQAAFPRRGQYPEYQGVVMGEKKPDLSGCLGLAIVLLGILLFVILAFILIIKYQPGFFQNFSPIV